MSRIARLLGHHSFVAKTDSLERQKKLLIKRVNGGPPTLCRPNNKQPIRNYRPNNKQPIGNYRPNNTEQPIRNYRPNNTFSSQQQNHISLWWRTQAQNVSYQFILFRQFTTLTFTSIDNTLSTQHTIFISLSHFTLMKDPSSKRQLSVYTISTVHYLNFQYFYHHYTACLNIHSATTREIYLCINIRSVYLLRNIQRWRAFQLRNQAWD